jgi:hypothetical protein
MKELRIPMLTSPTALSFGAEDWSRAPERDRKFELEGAADVRR